MIDLGLSQEEIREQILERAARKLADDAASSGYVGDRVGRLIDKRVDEAIGAKITSKIDDLLNDRLESMLTQPIQPVDIYGQAAGQPISIRDTLNEKSKDFWSKLVDKSGKELSSSSGYYDKQGAKTRAEWMVGKFVSEAFIDLVKQNAVNIIGAMKEQLRDEAVASVDKHLDALVKVDTKNLRK